MGTADTAYPHRDYSVQKDAVQKSSPNSEKAGSVASSSTHSWLLEIVQPDVPCCEHFAQWREQVHSVHSKAVEPR